jgi:Xaa-Pro aminopeptidase
MSGPRTALIGEPPTDRPVAAGDAVLFDLAPRRDGWWADSCATVCCGRPSVALRRRHDAVRAALDAGLRAARPGVRAAAVDAAVRAALDRVFLTCPHHTGHGVGARAQQAPWLNPGVETVLEAGTVVALEPGAYADGFGVRLEHLAVVEHGGARPLTTHSLELT